MSVSTDLDAWAESLATATGLRVTRDPDRVMGPCVFIGFPSAAATTIGEQFTLDLPVYLIPSGPGSKADGDWLLNQLPGLMAVLDRREALADVLTVDGTDFSAYRLSARIHITQE